MCRPQRRVQLPIVKVPEPTSNVSSESDAKTLEKLAVCKLILVPQFSLNNSRPSGGAFNKATGPWINEKFITAGIRFSRKRTAIFSGVMSFAGGYYFIVFALLRADRSLDLDRLVKMLSNPQDTNICAMHYHGSLYLPNDQPFYIGTSENDDSLHINDTCFFGPRKNSIHLQALGQNLLPSNMPTAMIQRGLQAMASAHIDNKLVPPNFDLRQLDVVDDYKQLRIQKYQNAQALYDQLFHPEGGISTSSSSSIHCLLSTQPYAPSAGVSLAWFGPFMVSVMEFIYAHYGAYLLFQWSPYTLSVTGPAVVNSYMRRGFHFHKNIREDQSGDLGGSEKDMIKLATIERARRGVSCRMFNEEVYSFKSYMAYMHHVLMHSYAYSKWRDFYRIPEDMLVWIAYLSGLTLMLGSEWAFGLGIALGLLNFSLRLLLQVSDVHCKGRGIDLLLLFFVNLVYGCCYVIKDMMALHYSLLFLPSWIKYQHNQSSINGTLNILLNGTDPWLAGFNYNQTFSLPFFDEWQLWQQIGLTLSICLVDLTYYSLLSARSSKEANPPGSRRFGYTGVVDTCGRCGIPLFTVADVFFSGMQSGEMLFGIQLVIQLMYSLSILDGNQLITLTFDAALYLAIAVGAIFGMVNIVMSCFLLAPGPQPWLLILDHAKHVNPDLSGHLFKVHVDFMQYEAEKDANKIDTSEKFITWLNSSKYDEKTAVSKFFKSIAIKYHWKILRHIMMQCFPCKYIKEDKEWIGLHQKLLKLSPLKVKQVPVKDNSLIRRMRAAVPDGGGGSIERENFHSGFWHTRTGNGKLPDARGDRPVPSNVVSVL
jgi:hypothetical protein